MTQCQMCQTDLVSDGMESGQQVRCVNCRHVFCFGREEKLSADRLAWRSFWLGLASICCIFITGIPAIYYGVRSLLRMRFTKTRPTDRFAAAAGTAMGGCFGLAGGFVAVFTSIIMAVTFYSLEHLKTPAEVKALFDRTLVADLPESLIPLKGISVLGTMNFFDFVDTADNAKQNLRLFIVYQQGAFQQPVRQLVQDLKSRSMGDLTYSDPFHAEKLNWIVLDEPVEVTKLYYKNARQTDEIGAPDSNDVLHDPKSLESQKAADGTVVRYYGLVKQSEHLIGIMVVMRLPQTEFSEDRVRELFSSVRPVGE